MIGGVYRPAQVLSNLTEVHDHQQEVVNVTQEGTVLSGFLEIPQPVMYGYSIRLKALTFHGEVQPWAVQTEAPLTALQPQRVRVLAYLDHQPQQDYPAPTDILQKLPDPLTRTSVNQHTYWPNRERFQILSDEIYNFDTGRFTEDEPGAMATYTVGSQVASYQFKWQGDLDIRWQSQPVQDSKLTLVNFGFLVIAERDTAYFSGAMRANYIVQ